MHNLKSNFNKILNITKSFYKGSIDADHNCYFYPNKPKMSDWEKIDGAPEQWSVYGSDILYLVIVLLWLFSDIKHKSSVTLYPFTYLYSH